jgi:stage V sporulation protein G
LDDSFIIHGVQLKRGKKGYSIKMPQVQQLDGTYLDVAYPLNNETRQMILQKVVAEYEKVTGESLKR